MMAERTVPDDALEFIRRCVRDRKVHWTYHVNMRVQVEKGIDMKCRVCGGAMRPSITDLPFKATERTIVILKDLPVAQCEACSEYVLADAVLARVEHLLSQVDASVELEIIPFAA
jgi:YgiT-type zinc finger domain-containing protein